MVKQFHEYPEDEAPAIRLSWAGAEDRANVPLGINSHREDFKVSSKGSVKEIQVTENFPLLLEI